MSRQRTTECSRHEYPDCQLDRNYTRTLFNFTHLVPPKNSYSQLYAIAIPEDYRLFFANCQPNSSATVNVRTEMYNLDGGNNEKNYLPVGQTQLPLLFTIHAAAYFLFALVWAYTWVVERSSQGSTIRLLMLGLILTQGLSLISAAMDKQCVGVTGTSRGWDRISMIFQILEAAFMCGVIVLIGTTWSILKWRGGQTCVTITLIIMLLLDVASRTVYTMIINTRPLTGVLDQPWVFIVIHFVTLLVTGYAVVVSIGFMCRNPGKKFIKARLYVYFSVLVLFQQSLITGFIGTVKEMDMVDYKHIWALSAVEEIATLLTYIGTFYLFHISDQKKIFFAVGGTVEGTSTLANVRKC